MQKNNSIVLELQQLAIDRSNNISDLLRKSLLVSSKLNLSEFEDWTRNELNGYTKNVPKYRNLKVKVKAKNPQRGLIPVMFSDSELDAEFEDILTNIEIYDPVESLFNLLEDDSGSFHYPISPEQQRIFNEIGSFTGRPQFEVIRLISRNQIAIVIDAVRNKILDWAIKLENENILGEGIFFSENEKEKAIMSKEINIQNFQGIIGDVSHSSLSQNFHMKIKQNDKNSLLNYLKEKGISNEDLILLEEAINNDPIPKNIESFGELTNQWIGRMVSKTIDGTWNVSIATAGGVLATAIGKYYGLL